MTATAPPTPAAQAPPAAHALTPEQIREVAAARARSRKVARAAVVSAISGWTLAIFAALSLLSGLFDLPSLLLGIGLAVTAGLELRGCRALRGFDLAAPRRLALNQVAVAAVVCMYAGWGILQALFGPGPYDSHLAGGGDLADALKPFDELTRAITVAFYGLVFALTLVVQSGAAVYHFTRRRHLEAFLRDTPPWVLDMLRAATG